jgi:nitrogen fixation protein NifU and related proteins
MADLQNLYQQSIIDHYKRPRNFRMPAHTNRQAEGFNPLCGDKLSIFLQIDSGIIHDIAFMGAGCAISIASASMMTESLKGKTEAEAGVLLERFCHMVESRIGTKETKISMGDLDVFSSVRGYPVRIKCATLAWHAARAALKVSQETVSTELNRP